VTILFAFKTEESVDFTLFFCDPCVIVYLEPPLPLLLVACAKHSSVQVPLSNLPGACAKGVYRELLDND